MSVLKFRTSVLKLRTPRPEIRSIACVGDDVIESLETVAVHELGIGQRVALHDQRGRVVVQDHVHPREAAGGGVLLLPVERDGGAGLVPDLQEQRSGTAGRVVHGGGNHIGCGLARSLATGKSALDELLLGATRFLTLCHPPRLVSRPCAHASGVCFRPRKPTSRDSKMFGDKRAPTTPSPSVTPLLDEGGEFFRLFSVCFRVVPWPICP